MDLLFVCELLAISVFIVFLTAEFYCRGVLEQMEQFFHRYGAFPKFGLFLSISLLVIAVVSFIFFLVLSVIILLNMSV